MPLNPSLPPSAPRSTRGLVVPVLARRRRTVDPQARGRAHGLLLAGAVGLLALAGYQGLALAADGGEFGVVLPGEKPLLEEASPVPAATDVEADIDVTVDLLPRARLRPGPRACRVLLGDQVEPAARVQWLAGSAAAPSGDVRVGDQQLLRIELGGLRTDRLITIRDTAELRVHLGGEVALHGCVTDTEGQPLAGARVWASGVETRSLADGTFAVIARGGDGLVVAVRADGMVAQALHVDGAGAPGLRFVLQPAGELRVRVLGPLPRRGAPVHVLVGPAAAADTSAEAQYPFFLQAVDGGWPVDARGVAILRDLPIGATVRASVDHPELLAVASPVVEVRARPVDLAVPVVRVDPLRGRVVDGEGQPLAGAWLTAWPESLGDELPREPAAAAAVPPAALRADAAFATSAADGSFALARGSAALRVAAGAVGRAAVDLVVKPDAPTSEFELLLPPALAPSGAAPSLQLSAGQEGRYRVQLRENGRPSRGAAAWTGAVPFSLPLRTAALADVRVRVVRDGIAREQLFRGIAVADVVELPLPR